ncbi:MAG: LysR family transcriptional regulator [Clostridiales bacterium]|nr:LysR family transcriptional regulator [Clostridiales bacterium]
MDTERINALICTIETGSLTAAAEKLGYTTSGISRMMAALEEETGFPLLFRSRSGVVPTEECRQLLPVMQELLLQADRYHQISGELAGLSRGTIRIGTSYYAYYNWFAGLIADFEKAYPRIDVQIIEGTSTELVAAMEEHRADLCIISRRQGSYDWIPLIKDELLACLPESHPLAKKKSFPVKAFGTEDFIELYPGKETDNSQMLRRNGVVPNVKYSTSDNYAAYAMVAAGLGVTCTNAIIGESFVQGVRYLPLSPRQPVEIGIALPKKTEMSPAARRFAEFARERS